MANDWALSAGFAAIVALAVGGYFVQTRNLRTDRRRRQLSMRTMVAISLGGGVLGGIVLLVGFVFQARS